LFHLFLLVLVVFSTLVLTLCSLSHPLPSLPPHLSSYRLHSNAMQSQKQLGELEADALNVKKEMAKAQLKESEIATQPEEKETPKLLRRRR